MKKVLLTGASGFIGRHCIAPLRTLGYEVHCVTSRGIVETEKHVFWHKTNLLNSADNRSLIDSVRPDALLHLAWFVEPGKAISDPVNIEWVEKSLGMIRYFREQGGKRAVIAGSNYEYDLRFGFLSELNTPRKPDTVYGTAKNSLYELFHVYCRQTDLGGAWGRVFDLYGPYENPHRLVPYVVLSMLKGEKARTSHARQIRDYMHVQDAANGLVALLNSNLTGDYNIASGQPVTLKHILLEIADILGGSDLLDVGAIPARENEVPIILADMRKFDKEDVWRPAFDLRSGLEQTIEWWRRNADFRRDA